MDIVQTLWGFCNTLRHDGINYGDYIEQLTYLLFLKLADEKGLEMPAGHDWESLRDRSGVDLLDHYNHTLRELGQRPGLLGDIFALVLEEGLERIPELIKQVLNGKDGILHPQGVGHLHRIVHAMIR